MGCPGGTRSVFTRAFLAKRELRCIFFGKKAIIITSILNTAQRFLFPITIFLTAAWLAHLGERRSAEREVAGSNCRPSTQGLQITEKKVLPL